MVTFDLDRGRRLYATDRIYTKNLTVTGTATINTAAYSATAFTTTGATTSALMLTGAVTNGLIFSSTATYGIVIPAATACTNAILIGDSTTTGMTVDATHARLVTIFGQIPTGATTNTSNLRCIWGRLKITAAAVLTGGGANIAGHFTTMVYGGTTTTLGSWATAGLWGSLGGDGVSTTTVSSGAYAAGIIAEFRLSSTNWTCSSGAVTSGLYVVMSAPTGVTMTGAYAGVYVENQGTAALTSAITVNATGVTNFVTFPAETGCAGATRGTPGQTATCDGSIVVKVGAKTLLIPLYNAVTVS
jgi:hypothetical protein